MISENEIDHIVSEFYQKALNDILIGYQFQKIEDFPKHVSKIASFWKNQLYPEHYPPVANIRFRAKHLPLHLNMGELGRWIILFYETLDTWNKNNNREFTSEINRWKEKIENLKMMLLSHPQMFRTNDQN
jgi:truncated hemoglobin YjbI